MITLLASIFGFLSSALPDVFRLFHDRSDKKHEMAILQLQLQSATAARLEEIGVIADMAESKALYRTYNTGVTWIDAFNGTVRPVITYAFFALYALVKYLQYTVIGDDAPLFQYLDALWNQEDQAIFASVISFYFGARTMSKLRAK